MDEDEDDIWSVTIDGQGRIEGSVGASDTSLAVWDNFVSIRRSELPAMRTEVQRSAWPLAAQSFWLPADATPTSPLEDLASRIFEFHTAGAKINRAASGAEWWSNVSRSEMIRSHGDINMHFDKDEKAFAEYGLVVSPLLATVTYLSDAGASTIVAPHTVLCAATFEYKREAGEPAAMIVPPKVGRHLRFDGRWLHGAPASYMPPAAAPYERVTFCVNIWIGHKPGRCVRFPADAAPTSAWIAPRLRLGMARGAAAQREAREAKITRVRCDSGCLASRDTHHVLRLEQTEHTHELLLPLPRAFDGTAGGRSGREAAHRNGQLLMLEGEGIKLQRAAIESDAAESDEAARKPKKQRV